MVLPKKGASTGLNFEKLLFLDIESRCELTKKYKTPNNDESSGELSKNRLYKAIMRLTKR